MAFENSTCCNQSPNLLQNSWNTNQRSPKPVQIESGYGPTRREFRGNGCNIMSPLCGLHLDNQKTICQCEEIRKQITINCGLDDIYRENVKLETAQKLTEIEEFRENRKKER